MLLERTRAYVEGQALLQAGQTLTVGVSGGPDSTVLLHLLTRLRSEFALRLTAAHLDHALRAESAAEADLVARLADSWGLPVAVERTDVAALARDRRLSIEEAGRIARYEFFARLGPAVAVAHNADDQAETVLMHFLRGSGLAGLRGMLPKTVQHSGGALTVIRPLLETPRADIEAYLAQHALPHVIDSSNADQTFFRNRLRHELIPFLESYNPNIRAVLGRTATVLAGDHDLLRALTADVWQATTLPGEGPAVHFRLGRWRALPRPLQRLLLREAIRRLSPNLRDLDFAPLEKALEWAETSQSGRTADLLGGLALQTVGAELRLVQWTDVAHGASDARLAPGLHPLAVPGTVQIANLAVVAFAPAAYTLADIEGSRDPAVAYVEAGRRPLFVRTRRPGERIQPLGMAGSMKLSDYMINHKIPVDERERWPLVCCDPDGGAVLWVPGCGLAEPGRVRELGSVIRLTLERHGQ